VNHKMRRYAASHEGGFKQVILRMSHEERFEQMILTTRNEARNETKKRRVFAWVFDVNPEHLEQSIE
jgi:hypothetical protein